MKRKMDGQSVGIVALSSSSVTRKLLKKGSTCSKKLAEKSATTRDMSVMHLKLEWMPHLLSRKNRKRNSSD